MRLFLFMLLASLPLMSGAAGFDVEAATRAYLDQIPAATRANSDAYYTGTYWLDALEALLTIAICWLLLHWRVTARLRDVLAARINGPFKRDMAFFALYTLMTFVLVFPFTVYSGFVREHAFGFSNASFMSWFGETAMNLALDVLLSCIAFAALYWIIRKLGKAWWMWGAAGGVSLMIVILFISPIYIQPLFNDYKPMNESAVKTEVLRIAKANGIPANDVMMVDASRQTKRVSANVSGIGSSVRIALNDNLLNRATPAGVAAVMGHEMGHYVLNHVVKMLLIFGLLLALGLLFVDRAFSYLQSRYGAHWNIHDLGDSAGFPLLSAVLTVYFSLATPLVNTTIRVHETEADYFGLNASREPDGFAEAILMTAEYRKAEPGYWEEIFFYDHPSPATRIRNAMQWKAAEMEKTPVVTQ